LQYQSKTYFCDLPTDRTKTTEHPNTLFTLR